MRAFKIFGIGVISLVVVGCGPKENWDLVTASNGVIYRIDKRTGEISLVTPLQITKLAEFREAKPDGWKKSHLKDWPEQKVKSLGNITLKLKTTWRDGKLHYILSVLPISSQLQKARDLAVTTARFNIDFHDADGFELLTVPVKLTEMARVVDDDGKPLSFNAAGSTACSVESYEALAISSIGWAGFKEE